MSYDAQGAKKGQAYNLAVAQAIKDGRGTDVLHIFSLYWFHLETAKLCTSIESKEAMEYFLANKKAEDVLNKVLNVKELQEKYKELTNEKAPKK